MVMKMGTILLPSTPIWSNAWEITPNVVGQTSGQKL